MRRLATPAVAPPLLLWLLLTAAAPAGLGPVPEPALESLPAAVQGQLRAARAAAVESGGNPAAVAAAYARLGKLYRLYEFPEASAAALAHADALGAGWEVIYLRGVLAQEAGHFEAAVGFFGQVLGQRVGDLPSLLRRGECLLRLRRLDGALRDFERASALGPASASAHFGLGRVRSARGDFAGAASSFKRTLELQPHADAVFHPLARVTRKLGDLAGARRWLERAGDSRPVLDDPVMAALVSESVVARTFLLQGDRARRRGLHGAAMDFYRRALELDPEDAGVHYNVGTLYAELGDLAAAELHFRAALEHDPGRADAAYNLAVGLRARGDLTGAVAAFERAVRLEAESPEARLELAATLYATGDRERATAELGRVLELPRDAALSLRLYRYRRAMADAAGAQAGLRADAERYPEDAALRLELARVEVNAPSRSAEGLGEAVRHFEAARRSAGDSEVVAAATLGLARALATAPPPLRDGARALALAGDVPEGVARREVLALAHAASGEFEEAARRQAALLAELAASGAEAPILARLQGNLRRFQNGEVGRWP
ncbi:MAG: tetratricopeptide repeat protein [Acidobacteriota bacterium]